MIEEDPLTCSEPDFSPAVSWRGQRVVGENMLHRKFSSEGVAIF